MRKVDSITRSLYSTTVFLLGAVSLLCLSGCTLPQGYSGNWADVISGKTQDEFNAQAACHKGVPGACQLAAAMYQARMIQRTQTPQSYQSYQYGGYVPPLPSPGRSEGPMPYPGQNHNIQCMQAGRMTNCTGY